MYINYPGKKFGTWDEGCSSGKDRLKWMKIIFKNIYSITKIYIALQRGKGSINYEKQGTKRWEKW